MPISTNANLGGISNLTDGNPSGSNLGASAAEKIAAYGKTPVVQASAIVEVTGTISLTTTINALLTAVRNFGIIA